MKPQFLLVATALFAMLLLGAGCFTTSISTQTTDNAAVKEIAATLRIDAGEGSVVSYGATLSENTTALAFLKTMSEEKQFTVQTKEYEGLGELVDGINGKTGTANEFWLFSINGTAATIGAGAYTVLEGDTIEFRWTKAE